MKVSKKSWHYRLIRKFHQPYEIPDDLCGYMRKLLLVLFVFFPLIALFGPFLLAFVFIEKGFTHALAWLGRRFARNEPPAKADPEPEEVRESIWRAWLRAKADKLCPLIEFTE